MSTSVDSPKTNSNRLDKKNWWERLAYVFARSPFNQTRFAAAVGVSSPTVHDWLHGNIKMIQGDHLVRVCQVLRVNPLWLITGQGEMMAADRRAGERRMGERRQADRRSA